MKRQRSKPIADPYPPPVFYWFTFIPTDNSPQYAKLQTKDKLVPQLILYTAVPFPVG